MRLFCFGKTTTLGDGLRFNALVIALKTQNGCSGL